MPNNFEKREKLEYEPNQDFIQRQFAELGIDIKEYPQILERLTELNERKESHFYDAVKMTEIIDLLWDKIESKNISKEKMKICALLHDIGKSGPEEASPSVRKIIEKLFEHKTFRDSRDKSIREALEEEKIEDKESVLKLLKELKIDIDKEKMIDFWHRHADWTYEILKNNQKGEIDEEVVIIASSHHILDGKNPANLPAEEIPDDAKTLEIMDKYQILTLIDKYQAYRGRSAYSHEEAIKALENTIKKSSLKEEIKNKYLRIIETLANSKEKLEQILEKRNA